MTTNTTHWESYPTSPFAYLGSLAQNQCITIRAFSPFTTSLMLDDTKELMTRVGDSDYFEWTGDNKKIALHYSLTATFNDGKQHTYIDPYSFKQIPPDNFDLHLFSQGNHWHIYNHLGAHERTINGIEGILFSVWAPNARRVSVVGSFNQWDGRRHPMQLNQDFGVWSLFIPMLPESELYRFEMLNSQDRIELKNDPYARQFELRPKNACVITKNSSYKWQDQHWLSERASEHWLHKPCSIYEVHLGSWMKDEQFHFMNYRELAHRLVDYLKPLNFTHIELLPITEHPLDASWGYQTLGNFAPTSRFGNPDDFRYFVDYCHKHDIGVILDWVPAHFPSDSDGLARFDGTALYEHEDPRKGEHRDWGTYIYNYGRNEVKNYLISSALFWLEEFHIDGLRVDAVASMLYLDYSREPHDWIPNEHGGNENLEAIEFLKHLNSVTQQQHPGILMIAEESTAWPMVSRPTDVGGLGFSMKWNMGWMHDTLRYFERDPIYRQHHHNDLTFGMMYAFTENFVLPFSHDEVVHGKSSLLGKMTGDNWQQFANLRLLYTFMFTYPGKKLLFMGCEFGQRSEWDFDRILQWDLLAHDEHKKVQSLIADLNRNYQALPALHYHDFDHSGFQWINCDDNVNSVLSFIRKSDSQTIVVVLNFTPVPREVYRIGIPLAGTYRELFNSDSNYYGGSNIGNSNLLYSEDTPFQGQPFSLALTIPPLAGLILSHQTD